MIRFGPAGNSNSFYAQGYKSTFQAMQWIRDMGLDAYEYSAGRGVTLREETARIIGEQAVLHGIALSLHAPYYINLASADPERAASSREHILKSLQAARWMGADRVIIHPGAADKTDRSVSFSIACQNLRDALQAADDQGWGDIALCPETLGKLNQLGNLEEILAFCQLDARLIPTIDFAHLHALGQGAIRGIEDYDSILRAIIGSLGHERARRMHIHFSRVEFSRGGEKRHRTLDETEYGPDFAPLAALLHRYDLQPRIICESQGTMAEDAVKLREIWRQAHGA